MTNSKVTKEVEHVSFLIYTVIVCEWLLFTCGMTSSRVTLNFQPLADGTRKRRRLERVCRSPPLPRRSSGVATTRQKQSKITSVSSQDFLSSGSFMAVKQCRMRAKWLTLLGGDRQSDMLDFTLFLGNFSFPLYFLLYQRFFHSLAMIFFIQLGN